MKLFLVRHGETEQNVAGILTGQMDGLLTDKGRTQAKEIALVLKNYKFTHIYSSDLTRCVDTTQCIKEFHPDTPVIFSKELRERDLGVFQGRHNKSVDWNILAGDYDNKKPENGESVVELKTRALNFVNELYKQHKDDAVLLVSSNAWIKQIISYLSDLPSKDVPKIENAQVIEVEIDKDLYR